MALKMIRVRAHNGGKLPHVAFEADGVTTIHNVGRYITDAPEGELVADHVYYHRAIAHGDVEIVDEPIAESTPAADDAPAIDTQ